MPTENPIIRAITMLQDYKGDLASRNFPDNDEGDYLQRVNENKRASVDAAIQGLRAAQALAPENQRITPVEPLLAPPHPLDQNAEPLYITHRPLIRNTIGLLGMRRPVAPEVERVIAGLEAMLEGLPTPGDAPSAEWLYAAELAAGQAEDAAGSASVKAMLGSALKRLTFAARTSGGTAGPDAELIAACEQAERAMSFVGIGQAYMAGVNSLSNAAQDVLAERNRQITAEGWTPEHDDKHVGSELADAAACYALWAGGINPSNWAEFWPWHNEVDAALRGESPRYERQPAWLKHSEPRRMLVKAGALILAEIERLDRAAAKQAEQEQQP